MMCPVCGSNSFDVVERNVGFMYWKVRGGRLTEIVGRETSSDVEETFLACAREDCGHIWSEPDVITAADIFPEIATG